MAACARRARGMTGLLRILRNLTHNERLLSTSVMRHAADSDGPPKFTPPTKPVIIDKTQKEASLRRCIQSEFVLANSSFIMEARKSAPIIKVLHTTPGVLSPEFIPPRQRTNPVKFSIERNDMMQRRKVLNIPEFYAGVEICYELYSPRIRKIEVLKLEKRLDDNLMYLRDALSEYSTFDFNMQPVHYELAGDVPVNPLKVKMRPKPWSKRWERPKFNIKGIRFDLCLTPEMMEHAQKWGEPWREFDMLKEYDTSSLEEQIFQEVEGNLSK